MNTNIKRLIEVDLPIKRISEHARKEKNMRTGHPWHLHIWWARRPWGACRSVAFASLIPAPSDINCPKEFIVKVASLLSQFGFCGSQDSNPQKIEEALLRFTGELARFEAGNEKLWIDTARKIIQLANHEIPLAFDPFSGYGAIPAEAARLGCQSVASDINPVAVLCLKIMLEAVPKHGEKLLELYKKGTEFIKIEAEKRLSQYYPKKNGKYPIAYLWARTVQCEGPACGAIIPLISQTIIAKGKRKAWIEIKGDKSTKKISIELKMGEKIPSGLIKTAGGGHAVCPVCSSTTHKDRVKAQGKSGKMGHRLFGVALPVGEREGKEYYNADVEDHKAFDAAVKVWTKFAISRPELEITEKYPYHDPRAFTPGLYGITTWGDLFSPRQKLSLHTLGELVKEYEVKLLTNAVDKALARDTSAALALGISNIVHYNTNISTWLAEHMISSFITGNAMAMRWDWAEANPIVNEYVGGVDFSFKKGLEALQTLLHCCNYTTILHQNATELNLPDESADFFFSDPPYYDVVPYADLSDLCFVWLKRFLKHDYKELFNMNLTPKAEQIVVNPYGVADGRGEQSPMRYRERMTKAFAEGRRALKSDGIGCIVFAHKGTSAWETLLASIVNAGFVVTASWPIDTERASRMRANDSAALQTSVHLVVRPRGKSDASIGDWRDVLRELAPRIKIYMKRMSDEGVAGADAIFACLGPALEIFSRYSVVEKPNGDVVTLREYMEKIWETVSREALAMLFDDVETQGFEADARVTAIWLWTLASESVPASSKKEEAAEDDDDNEEKSSKTKGGFMLDSDTANRISMSLGAEIHDLKEIIEIKGEKSRLISVRERMDKLFKIKGQDEKKVEKRKKTDKHSQKSLFSEWAMKEVSAEIHSEAVLQFEQGKSILDRLHQAMLFFGLGRTSILRKFLAEDGVGKDELFWKLAQALNSLYPQNTEERRWLEGVQAYRKSLNL
ncbi:MAG: DUF1156 domain-containing protein [Desulfobacterales bacterium]|nr:DUF1156 domain-containing protein [Desulfobacterales bacterium]